MSYTTRDWLRDQEDRPNSTFTKDASRDLVEMMIDDGYALVRVADVDALMAFAYSRLGDRDIEALCESEDALDGALCRALMHWRKDRVEWVNGE